MCGDGRDVSLIERLRLIIYPTTGIVEEQDILIVGTAISIYVDIYYHL